MHKISCIEYLYLPISLPWQLIFIEINLAYIEREEEDILKYILL